MSSHGSVDDEPIDDTAVRRNVWRLLLIVGPLAAVGGVLGSWLGDHSRHQQSHHHHVSAVVAVAVIVVILAVGGVANWLVWRRRFRDPAFRRSFQYAMTERRRALRDFRKGRELTSRQRQIVSATLVMVRRNQKYLPYTAMAFVLLGVVNVVWQHGSERWIGIGYLVVLPTVMFVSYFHSRALVRRAEQSDIESPR